MKAPGFLGATTALSQGAGSEFCGRQYFRIASSLMVPYRLHMPAGYRQGTQGFKATNEGHVETASPHKQSGLIGGLLNHQTTSLLENPETQGIFRAYAGRKRDLDTRSSDSWRLRPTVRTLVWHFPHGVEKRKTCAIFAQDHPQGFA